MGGYLKGPKRQITIRPARSLHERLQKLHRLNRKIGRYPGTQADIILCALREYLDRVEAKPSEPTDEPLQPIR